MSHLELHTAVSHLWVLGIELRVSLQSHANRDWGLVTTHTWSLFQLSEVSRGVPQASGIYCAQWDLFGRWGIEPTRPTVGRSFFPGEEVASGCWVLCLKPSP